MSNSCEAENEIIFEGYGEYISLSDCELPSFFLVYSPNPSDSGRIHSNVKQRWLNGEQEIVEGKLIILKMERYFSSKILGLVQSRCEL